MLVILFRHGPAGRSDPKRWPDDRARPLTPGGEKRTRRAAAGLARILKQEKASPVQVWTSPLVRTQQTARRVADELGGERKGEPVVVPQLAPGGSVRGLLERLVTAVEESKKEDLAIVLVGHEPDLGQLAGELALDPPAVLSFKKAGAAAVRFDGAPRRRTGSLEWFLPPRLLRRLARRSGGSADAVDKEAS